MRSTQDYTLKIELAWCVLRRMRSACLFWVTYSWKSQWVGIRSTQLWERHVHTPDISVGSSLLLAIKCNRISRRNSFLNFKLGSYQGLMCPALRCGYTAPTVGDHLWLLAFWITHSLL